MRAATVSSPPRTDLPPDLSATLLYLLAVLFAARRSKDRVLKRVTRRRLNSLGVRITFCDELPAHNTTEVKGAIVADFLVPGGTDDRPTAADLDPLALDQSEAAKLTSLSAKTLGRLADAGEPMGRIKVGRRVLYHRVTLAAWFAARAARPTGGAA